MKWNESKAEMESAVNDEHVHVRWASSIDQKGPQEAHIDTTHASQEGADKFDDSIVCGVVVLLVYTYISKTSLGPFYTFRVS
jgi:hypothetical protein